MAGSLTFLTPSAGVVALAVLAPAAALALARTRVRRVRRTLGLPPPARAIARARLVAVAGIPLLLALAAAQPVLRSAASRTVRTDAAAFVVVDTSESMSAAAGPHAPTRLEQAKRVALAAGSALGSIPIGVATFTDRVLPDLFPTADQATFDSTIRSLAIASPPPRETSRVATSFGALAALARAGYFLPTERHRAILLISDGESRAFDASALARTLAARPRVQVVAVRVGGSGDRLYANGRAAGTYRADTAGARQAMSELASATGGRVVTSGAAAAAALRRALGTGPTRHVGTTSDERALAPFIVLLALLPLLYALRGPDGQRSLAPRARRRAS
jgi:hypothetical protein